MPLVVKDRVQETTTTTGTGTITLAGAVSGFQSFSVIGNANTTYYTIVHESLPEWEVGIGTYTASGTTLSRDTILESSNSGSAVNFSAGTKDVFVTYPAEKAVYTDGSNNVTLPANLSVNGNTTLGDASGDSVTFNASTVSTPNGLNFDSNTFVIDAANNRVGIGTATPEEQLQITGNFRIGSAVMATPSGSTPLYACRAWVNFNGSGASNVSGTYSQTGTTVTVTITGHGYITGNLAYLDFTTGTAVDGSYSVTVVDANTFTVTQASRTTSGNVTAVRNTIRASGNVSSVSDNAAGDYTVNYATAMTDANYAFLIARDINAGATFTSGMNTTVGLATTSIRIFTAAGTALGDSGWISVAILR